MYLSSSYVLADDQAQWVKAMTEKIYQLIRETPPDGDTFAKAIEARQISLSDSAHYVHTNLLRTCITTELWEIPIFSPAYGAMILHMIRLHYFIGV